MGEAYGGICKKCGYSFTASLGVGFLFPIVYQDTVQKMKCPKCGGKFGFDGTIIMWD